jgi:GNAT superfamily N-acetyltransferase
MTMENPLFNPQICKGTRKMTAAEVAVSDTLTDNLEKMPVVDTPAFKAWFKDSKVVNPDGTPRVVYHGSKSPWLTEFSLEFEGSGVVNSTKTGAIWFTSARDNASWFADYRDKFEADVDNPMVYGDKNTWYAAVCAIPEDEDGEETSHIFDVGPFSTYEEAEAEAKKEAKLYNASLHLDTFVIAAYLRIENPYITNKVPRAIEFDAARKGGHDGIIAEGVHDGATISDVFVVFNPNQIKSATRNSGKFDPKDNRITASSGMIRLYRGMEQPFDKNFDLTKTDAPNGYSTWTDNPELAKQYAGEKGYIYQIDLPKSELGYTVRWVRPTPNSVKLERTGEMMNKNGERALFFNNGKNVGLNGVSGNEYLVYHHHDGYSPSLIKPFDSSYKAASICKGASDEDDYDSVTSPALFQTPQFKAWFGNSKLIDKCGNPIVMYHGTASDFDEFLLSKAKDTEGRRSGLGLGKGKFYFTYSPYSASSAAEWAAQSKDRPGNSPNVMPVYLKMENPIDSDTYGTKMHQIIKEGYTRDQAITLLDKELKEQGCDGITCVGGCAVYNPNQIKSAIGNSGKFDPNSKKITAAQTQILAAESDLQNLYKYLTMSDKDQHKVFAETFPDEWYEDHEEDPSEASSNELEYFWEMSYRIMRYERPEECPAFMFLTFKRMMTNGWVAHFSSHATEIAKNGFTKGVSDVNKLGLTLQLEDIEKSKGGYNFGFPLDDPKMLKFLDNNWQTAMQGYGNGLILACVDAIVVDHETDNHDQAIFFGSDVKEIVQVTRVDDGWNIQGEVVPTFAEILAIVNGGYSKAASDEVVIGKTAVITPISTKTSGSQVIKEVGMSLWHGGRISGSIEVQKPTKGRYEAGPGLYLTTSYQRAYSYAKGGGSTFLVTLKPNLNFADDVQIPLQDGIEFATRYLGSKGKSIIADLKSNCTRMKSDTFSADTLINLVVNYEVGAGSKGLALVDFLVEHGVDASKEDQGNKEQWVVVFNPNAVTKIKKVPAKEVTSDMWQLPKVGSHQKKSDQPTQDQNYDDSITQTPKFKSWFQGSKVIDDHGRPLRVYKGMYPYDYTNKDKNGKEPLLDIIERPTPFPTFDPKDPEGVTLAGFFASDPNIAQKFICQGATFPCFLSIKDPYIINGAGKMAGDLQFGATGKPFRDAIRSGKYDGVILTDTQDEGTIYVPLRPTQIKSAIGNNGDFDPENKRITASHESLTFITKEGKEGSKPASASTIWYHGSRNHFDQFKTVSKATTSQEVAEVPIFLTPDLEFARWHAGLFGWIYKVKANVTNTFDGAKLLNYNERYYRDPQTYPPLGKKLYEDIADNKVWSDGSNGPEGYIEALANRNWDTTQSPEFIRWMKANGYDSFLEEGEGQTNLGVFDPSKLEILSSTSVKEMREKEKTASNKNPTLKVMTGRELALAIQNTDPNVYNEMKYIGVSRRRDETHLTLWIGELLVADLELQENPHNPNQLWLMHVSTRKGYTQQGFASSLLNHAFSLAKKEKKDISLSSYSDEGSAYLPSVIKRISLEYPEVKVTSASYDYDKTASVIYRKGDSFTNTPKFKSWFAGSKVVDSKGEPLLMHHGTKEPFTKVDLNKSTLGMFWTTSDIEGLKAGEVGANSTQTILDCYISLKNPAGWDEYKKKSIAELKHEGYDGLLLPESDGTCTAVAFKGNQVKIASERIPVEKKADLEEDENILIIPDKLTSLVPNDCIPMVRQFIQSSHDLVGNPSMDDVTPKRVNEVLEELAGRFEGNELQVYRSMDVPSNWSPSNQVVGGCGLCWSLDDTMVMRVLSSDSDDIHITLCADVPLSSVDWVSTIGARIVNVEDEVRLIPGAPLTINHIDGIEGTHPIQVFANSNTMGSIKFTDEVVSSYSGQDNHILTATVNDAPVAYIEFSDYHDEPHVKYIYTHPDYARQGYATALLKELQRMYPNEEIDLGMTTDEGGKLVQSLNFNEQSTEYTDKFKQLEQKKQERDKLQADAEKFYDKDSHTEQEKQEFLAYIEPLNTLNDEIWDLEQEIYGKKPIKRIIAATLHDERSLYTAKSATISPTDRILYHGTNDEREFDTLKPTGGDPVVWLGKLDTARDIYSRQIRGGRERVFEVKLKPDAKIADLLDQTQPCTKKVENYFLRVIGNEILDHSWSDVMNYVAFHRHNHELIPMLKKDGFDGAIVMDKGRPRGTTVSRNHHSIALWNMDAIESQQEIKTAGESLRRESDSITASVESDKTETKLGDFMLDFLGQTTENPLNHREQIWHDSAAIECTFGFEHTRGFRRVIHLSGIRTFEKSKGQGHDALKWLCGLADKHGVTLHLNAVPFGEGGLTQNKLRSWYMRNGFEPTRNSEMVREPKAEGSNRLKLNGGMMEIPMDKTSSEVSTALDASGVIFVERKGKTCWSGNSYVTKNLVTALGDKGSEINLQQATKKASRQEDEPHSTQKMAEDYGVPSDKIEVTAPKRAAFVSPLKDEDIVNVAARNNPTEPNACYEAYLKDFKSHSIGKTSAKEQSNTSNENIQRDNEPLNIKFSMTNFDDGFRIEALKDGNEVGMIRVKEAEDRPGTVFIKHVQVLDPHQGQGIGFSLYCHAIEKAKEFGYSNFSSSPTDRSWYANRMWVHITQHYPVVKRMYKGVPCETIQLSKLKGDIPPLTTKKALDKKQPVISNEDKRDALDVMKGYALQYRVNIGNYDISTELDTAFKTAKLESIDLALLKPHYDWGRRPHSDTPIIVAHFETGEYVILDGQHRVIEAKEKGEHNIKAFVLSLPFRSKPSHHRRRSTYNNPLLQKTSATEEEERAAANQFENEKEYLKHHITGYIPSESYTDEMFNLETHPWQAVEKNPKLLKRVQLKDGSSVDLRQSGEKNSYVKQGEPDASGYSEILRDENGLALDMSDEEIKEKKLPLYDTSIVAFSDKGECIGLASDEFGADGVWVRSDYQGKGLGTILLTEFRKQFPSVRQMGQMTESGKNLAGSYYRSLTGKPPAPKWDPETDMRYKALQKIWGFLENLKWLGMTDEQYDEIEEFNKASHKDETDAEGLLDEIRAWANKPENASFIRPEGKRFINKTTNALMEH